MNEEALYQLYLSLGPSRKLTQVAEQTGTPVNTLYKLSGKNRWKARIKEDTYHKYRLENSKENDVSDAESVLTAISEDSLLKLRESIRNLKPNSARDAKALLEIYLLLQGRATIITQSQGDNRDELYSFILQLLTTEQLERVSEWYEKSGHKSDIHA